MTRLTERVTWGTAAVGLREQPQGIFCPASSPSSPLLSRRPRNGFASTGHCKGLPFGRAATPRSHVGAARRDHRVPLRTRPGAIPLLVSKHPGLMIRRVLDYRNPCHTKSSCPACTRPVNHGCSAMSSPHPTGWGFGPSTSLPCPARSPRRVLLRPSRPPGLQRRPSENACISCTC